MKKFSEIPHRTMLNGSFIEHGGALFERAYLFEDIPLPPLLSPSLPDLRSNISELHYSFVQGIWNDKTKQDKISVIRSAVDDIRNSLDLLSFYDSVESGRSKHSLLRDSYPKALETIDWFCASFLTLTGSSYQSQSSSSIGFLSREPHGVCVCFLPWNDPLVLFAWKVIPALLLGNSVIVKPSEYATASILAFCKALIKAGVPSNVLSVVVGRDQQIFKELCSNELVRCISLTGSTSTALTIQRLVSESGTLKKLSFECGGKSPFLLLSSNSQESLKKACEVIAKNMFYNQGQICSAPSVLACISDHSGNIQLLLKQYWAKYFPQDPLLSGAEVGTLCIPGAAKRIRDFIDRVEEFGIKVVQLPGDIKRFRDCAIPPTLIVVSASVYLSNRWLHEEIFGPVLTIVEGESLDDLITVANASPYGLAAGVWSESIHDAMHASKCIQSGVVHINSYGDDPVGMPFGGIKNSGEAKEKCNGSFDQFSYQKLIYMCTHIS
jgi:acyl-CoA reductase-like NAD-dependent aldehyde dehydrogenase